MNLLVLLERGRVSCFGWRDGAKAQKFGVALIGALVVSTVLSACSTSGSGLGSGPGGETTCREWLALDANLSAEERLYEGKENKEQQAILKRMLDAHGRDTGDANRVNVEWAIIQFCFPDDTGTRQNIDRPIEEAIDW